ncbi:hypothetical protein LTR56_007892 [Elasticomyces elasticus]|nr:hypothetical protein LTR56_007892 [Elasticomyces elasticus]KAK3663689.1 hypothetical protein LTR22_005390 [Elasticomyces elasticus]KAK4927207.1 hypothetical protein LTR49_005872 [Elasticomyces elasticus]KAK5767387.1 hypothetical protein LTS12_002540 [Elasticomyces elasticus]
MADPLRTELKAEIEAVIAEYTKPESGKPPYTTAQLLVMAAICSGKTDVTEQGTLRWLTSTFPYYAQHAIDEFIARRSSGPHFYYGNDQVAPDMKRTLKEYDLPLQTIRVSPISYSGTRKQLMLSPARIYLQSILEYKRQGTFGFLKLPAELRNVVYEMLFIFHEQGFTETWHESPRTLPCRDAEHYDPATSNESGAHRYNYQQVRAPSTSKVLAILRTCKQICNETMPYFYRDNHFRYETLDAFSSSISSLNYQASHRVQNLSSLYIGFRAHDDEGGYVLEALEALKSAKNLRRLELNFESDDEWLKMRPKMRRSLGSRRTTSFTKFEQIPVFPPLAVIASHAKELIITGDCPQIEAYLTDEVKRLRQVKADELEQAAEAVAGPVKRKRGRGKDGATRDIEPVKRTKRQEALAAKAKSKTKA